MTRTGEGKTASAGRVKPLQEKFVTEYLKDFNATQAAIRAGYSAKTARQMGAENLTKPVIQEEIVRQRDLLSKEAGMTTADVLKLWIEQATCDVQEIVEFRRIACEECWPDGVPAGVDRRDPDPECRLCRGEGRGEAHFKDSRKLTGAARRLYNGVQITKDGVKVLLLDRDKALEQVGRILGSYEADNKLKVELPQEEVTSKLAAILAKAKLS